MSRSAATKTTSSVVAGSSSRYAYLPAMRRGDFEDLVRRHLDGELVPGASRSHPSLQRIGTTTNPTPCTKQTQKTSTGAILPSQLASIRGASTCGFNSTQAAD